jgi:rRNA processing protein Gar1
MSYRGRGGSFNSNNRRGGGNQRSGYAPQGPPDHVVGKSLFTLSKKNYIHLPFFFLYLSIFSKHLKIEMGSFLHACEGEMVCAKLPQQAKIPYFNAPIYLENKTPIGKVDEILGPINEVYFTVKLQEGVLATSFKVSDKVYIAPDKLLPLDRFLPKPKAAKGEMISL